MYVLVSVILVVAGFTQAGVLGAFTGVAVGFFATAALRTRTSAGGAEWLLRATRINGYAMLLFVLSGAVLAGWRWGWLGSFVGFIAGMLFSRAHVLVRGRGKHGELMDRLATANSAAAAVGNEDGETPSDTGPTALTRPMELAVALVGMVSQPDYDAEAASIIRQHTSVNEKQLRFEVFAARVAAIYVAVIMTYESNTARAVLHHFFHVMKHLAKPPPATDSGSSPELERARVEWGRQVDKYMNDLRTHNEGVHERIMRSGLPAFEPSGIEERVREYSRALGLNEAALGVEHAGRVFAGHCGAQGKLTVELLGAGELTTRFRLARGVAEAVSGPCLIYC